MALFLLRTAEGREGLAFWLLDALATDILPGYWEQLSHISTADAGAVSIRCGAQHSLLMPVFDRLQCEPTLEWICAKSPSRRSFRDGR